MRVVHHDGFTGSVVSIGNEWCEVDWGHGIRTLVRSSSIRPLGPIEEEMRSGYRDEDGSLIDCGWSDKTHDLWKDCADNFGLYHNDFGIFIDADSEALEACERIWEQHGVAL